MPARSVRFAHAAAHGRPHWSWSDAKVAQHVRAQYPLRPAPGGAPAAPAAQLQRYLQTLAGERCEVGPQCKRLLVEAHAARGSMLEARTVFESIPAEHRVELFGTLAYAYSFRGDVDSLRRMLALERREVGRHSELSYASILKYFAQTGMEKEADDVVDDMRRSGMAPSARCLKLWVLSSREYATAVARCERLGADTDELDRMLLVVEACCDHSDAEGVTKGIGHVARLLRGEDRARCARSAGAGGPPAGGGDAAAWQAERRKKQVEELWVKLLRHYSAKGDLKATLFLHASGRAPRDKSLAALLRAIAEHVKASPLSPAPAVDAETLDRVRLPDSATNRAAGGAWTNRVVPRSGDDSAGGGGPAGGDRRAHSSRLQSRHGSLETSRVTDETTRATERASLDSGAALERNALVRFAEAVFSDVSAASRLRGFAVQQMVVLYCRAQLPHKALGFYQREGPVDKFHEAILRAMATAFISQGDTDLAKACQDRIEDHKSEGRTLLPAMGIST
ncbi:hypothetical protein DIPPA_05422 [Diplonema papillatum]|nr:hypothetical protein DIPPA_05422 [Diplonema papillatum]